MIGKSFRGIRWLGLGLVGLSLGGIVALTRVGCGVGQAQNLNSTGATGSATAALQRADQALQARQGAIALQYLNSLSDQLPDLADQIVMMQAQAYEQIGNTDLSRQTWATILSQYSNSPLVPRALVGLGRWDELRSRFPYSPLALPVLQQGIVQQPQNYALIQELQGIIPLLKNSYLC